MQDPIAPVFDSVCLFAYLRNLRILRLSAVAASPPAKKVFV